MERAGGRLIADALVAQGVDRVFVVPGESFVDALDGLYEVRDRIQKMLDVPQSLVSTVVFDQSQYAKTAVANLLREGGSGLVLTAAMILIFLGSARGTISVLLSIPISCLAAFLLLNATGSSINTMVLGGLALVLSRLIDNSVVVLENIFRHLEDGEDAVTAAEPSPLPLPTQLEPREPPHSASRPVTSTRTGELTWP